MQSGPSSVGWAAPLRCWPSRTCTTPEAPIPTITLLRHGQASFGAADYDRLSELGRQQAALAADALEARGVRDPLIISGTLSRQRDTATIVADRLGADVPDVDGRWDEYDHLGLVQRFVAAAGEDPPPDTRAFQAVLDRALADWIEEDAADGWRAFAGGAVAALHDVGASLDGRDAVVATSGGVIAAVCASVLRAPAGGVVALNRVVVNAGLTTFLVGGSGLNLLTFNDHTHLTGDRAAMRTYR